MAELQTKEVIMERNAALQRNLDTLVMSAEKDYRARFEISDLKYALLQRDGRTEASSTDTGGNEYKSMSKLKRRDRNMNPGQSLIEGLIRNQTPNFENRSNIWSSSNKRKFIALIEEGSLLRR